jgi:hypothetical protein
VNCSVAELSRYRLCSFEALLRNLEALVARRLSIPGPDVAMTESRKYKVFYSFLESVDDVSHDDPVEMTLEDVCSHLFPRLKHHNDFFGLLDQRGGCFQIRIYGGYLLDVPVPEREGSLELVVDEAEALRRLQGIPPEITPAAFADYQFEPWRGVASEPKPWWRFW